MKIFHLSEKQFFLRSGGNDVREAFEEKYILIKDDCKWKETVLMDRDVW